MMSGDYVEEGVGTDARRHADGQANYDKREIMLISASALSHFSLQKLPHRVTQSTRPGAKRPGTTGPGATRPGTITHPIRPLLRFCRIPFICQDEVAYNRYRVSRSRFAMEGRVI